MLLRAAALRRLVSQPAETNGKLQTPCKARFSAVHFGDDSHGKQHAYAQQSIETWLLFSCELAGGERQNTTALPKGAGLAGELPIDRR